MLIKDVAAEQTDTGRPERTVFLDPDIVEGATELYAVGDLSELTPEQIREFYWVLNEARKRSRPKKDHYRVMGEDGVLDLHRGELGDELFEAMMPSEEVPIEFDPQYSAFDLVLAAFSRELVAEVAQFQAIDEYGEEAQDRIERIMKSATYIARVTLEPPSLA